MSVTQGNSMRPSIMAGAVLQFKKDKEHIAVGDVIAFIGDDGTMAAHRVIEITRNPETVFTTQGDSVACAEQVPQSAVIGVVDRVEYSHFSYSADGPAGRFFKNMALGKKLRWRIAKRAVRRALYIYQQIKHYLN